MLSDFFLFSYDFYNSHFLFFIFLIKMTLIINTLSLFILQFICAFIQLINFAVDTFQQELIVVFGSSERWQTRSNQKINWKRIT